MQIAVIGLDLAKNVFRDDFLGSATIPHWALGHGENHSTYRLPFLGAAFGAGHGKRLTLQKETEMTCRRPVRTKAPRISRRRLVRAGRHR
jgi:hypothetical protein